MFHIMAKTIDKVYVGAGNRTPVIPTTTRNTYHYTTPTNNYADSRIFERLLSEEKRVLHPSHDLSSFLL
jgi:hypothetical protein